MIPPLLALFSWPAIVAMMASGRGIGVMICISVIGGYLFLPVEGGLDLPLLPAFDKEFVPALVAVIGAMIMASGTRERNGLPGWLPRSNLVKVLIAVLVLGPFLTVVTNPDAVSFPLEGIFLPALQSYDGFSYVLSSAVMLIPLFVGRKFLADPASQRLLLQALCLAALVYSPLVLYEIRMSPQLSAQFYGFFPHSWIQHIRGDGYRPIVFFEHGLRLAIFLATATMAAASLSRRSTGSTHGKYILASLWLMAVLVLAKSLGALLIAVVSVTVVFLSPLRIQMMVAAGFVALTMLYPVLRGAGFIPIEQSLELIRGFSPERAASLGIRFQFEGLLLDRAQDRPLFGWGGNGRSLLQTERTIPDGQWIITLGLFGWTGFFGFFGLMGFPILMLWWESKRIAFGPETIALCLIIAGSMVDLIPNAGMNPVIWLTAGALWGRLELGRISDDITQQVTDTLGNRDVRNGYPKGYKRPPPASENVYTRQKKQIERKLY